MKQFSEEDLRAFQAAILKDYGLKLEGDELYQAAFNLLQFLEALIKFDRVDKKTGSKAVPDNPLNSSLKNKQNKE